MSFKYDENNAGISPITKAGEYEVYPSAYVYTLTKATRNPMITMNYKVRDDVDQDGAGSEIRYDNFVDTPKSDWRFNALIKATGAFESGHEFGTLQGWAEEMLGKPVRVKVAMTTDKNGKQYPEIKSFKATAAPDMTEVPEVDHQGGGSSTPHASKSDTIADPFADNGKPIEINEDDLPF